MIYVFANDHIIEPMALASSLNPRSLQSSRESGTLNLIAKHIIYYHNYFPISALETTTVEETEEPVPKRRRNTATQEVLLELAELRASREARQKKKKMKIIREKWICWKNQYKYKKIY